MKKLRFSVILLALVFVAGLWLTAPDETIVLMAVTAPEMTAPQITREDILDIFNGYAYADPSNRRIIGCTVMEQSQYGILGVVQYTTEDEEGCHFDFIRQGAPPLQAGVDAAALEDTLEFWKADSVSCQILDKQGAVHVCRLTYYQDEAEAGFRIETEQKEG